MHYDPMLAKLIVHGDDRDQALSTLNRALAALDVRGVVTNRAFLQRLASHPAFRAAKLDTRFIEHHHADLFEVRAPSAEDYASAALVALDQLGHDGTSDSPWDRHDGFRLNADHRIRVALSDPKATDAEPLIVDGRRPHDAAPWRLTIQGTTLSANLQRLDGDAVAVTLDGHRRRLLARLDGNAIVLADAQGETRLDWLRADAVDHGQHEAESTLTAPMHGTVVALLVEPGTPVEKGMPLMVMEAMKMEHTLSAPADGQVASFHFAAGDTVGQGEVLLEFAIDE